MSYLKEWETHLTLKNKMEVFLRPQLSTDTEMLWEMFSTLSKQSSNNLIPPFTRDRIESWTANIDYERHLTILALIREGDRERVIGSATLSFSPHEIYVHRAGLGITVHDKYQNLGLGTALMKHLLKIAMTKGLKKVHLRVNADNARAVHVYEKCGFTIEGRLKKERFQEGKYLDEYCMSIFFE
ncbi:MAG: GNAT family N-acetyltransferase [Candidatus Bathyarchaeota archaeon]|nr:MAG: GNAT family N-acetyltransferase [Candidatus Bathyarchaeota archaeon]